MAMKVGSSGADQAVPRSSGARSAVPQFRCHNYGTADLAPLLSLGAREFDDRVEGSPQIKQRLTLRRSRFLIREDPSTARPRATQLKMTRIGVLKEAHVAPIRGGSLIPSFHRVAFVHELVVRMP